MKTKKPITDKFHIHTLDCKISCPEWTKPQMATLPKAPKWLRKYKFFTHRKLTEMRQFNLTELTTGMAVIQNCPSRKCAIKRGVENIIATGRKKFQSAVKSANLPPR